MILKPQPAKGQKEILLTINNFKGGTNLLVDEARASSKFAVESVNLIQVQDGLWKTRWGFNYYGQKISGASSIDGASEYIKSDGTRELIAVAGGYAWKSQDGGSWTQLSGATFTEGKRCYFLQIENYLYITNGTDKLARYNGTSLATYNEISAPTNVQLTRGSGLSSGSYTYYYQVVALNDIGYTTGSTEASITVNKLRNKWTSTNNEYIDITWNAVSGATRYEIYISDESGYEIYLASSTTNSYRDDGSDEPNPYIEVPDDNTTAAPKFKQMELSGNRIWATNDENHPYRVYFSGSGQYITFFSPFYGGGWIDFEGGGRDTPVGVVHYRTGKGDSVATVLCSSPEGRGSIWQVALETTTVGDVSFIVPAAYKVVGSIGSNAPYSIVRAGDNIFFANKRGIFSLRNKPQMLNILSTDEISQAIRPKYKSLNGEKIQDICGYYIDGKVFFSAASGSTNDKIFIFDTERGSWNWYWTQGVNQFLEYTDNDGITHFLGVPPSGNQLVEISENYLGDFGTAFYQSYISPLLPVSAKKTDKLKLQEAILELGRPKGTVYFEILGLSEGGMVTSIGTAVITNFGSNSGIGTDLWSQVLFSDTSLTPQTFTQATTKKAIKKKKKIYALQFKVYSNQADTDFTILSLQARGRLLPGRIPSSWIN